ncbi:LuxR C-terminal-related transcriptional regulator [Geobacter argillaceus]|uniref:LuxR C-terminal-related transcriptional regulator n=1 Tax=Geobacter argillaceus TaxID=345631 RepID=UPI0011A9CCC7
MCRHGVRKKTADSLHLSVHTVHTHMTHIYEKLQAKGRNDAIMKARKKGIL